MGILIWLLIGLIAGLIARALVPGSDSMGVLGTLVGLFIPAVLQAGKVVSGTLQIGL